MSLLLLWGKGGHARVVKEQALALGYSIEQLDDNDTIAQTKKFASTHPPQAWKAHVAIGDNVARARVTTELKRLGYEIVSIISPKSYISPAADIGKGVFIAQQCVIQPGTTIGDGTIVNTNASIDHDCMIGQYAHIAPGARLCGGCTVGFFALIGVGACLIPNIQVGPHVCVGGGAVVVKHLLKTGTYVGNPARKVIYDE